MLWAVRKASSLVWVWPYSAACRFTAATFSTMSPRTVSPVSGFWSSGDMQL